MGSAEFVTALDAINTFVGAIGDVTGGLSTLVGSADGLLNPAA